MPILILGIALYELKYNNGMVEVYLGIFNTY